MSFYVDLEGLDMEECKECLDMEECKEWDIERQPNWKRLRQMVFLSPAWFDTWTSGQLS